MLAIPNVTLDVLTTGNSELDKRMGGGIPRGSLTFVEGSGDSGKSVLTQQLIWGSLRNGWRDTVFTTENTVRSFVKQMESLNLGILDHTLLGTLKIFPIKASKIKPETGTVLDTLTNAFKTQEGRDLLVVDSLTSFINKAATDEVIPFFEDCKSLCNTGLSIVVVFHTYAFDESLLARVSSLCDAHLKLSCENMGTKLVKVLEVSKVRGAKMATGNICSFDVEPGWGMRIIPFSKARA